MAYEYKTMFRANVFEWFKRFNEGTIIVISVGWSSTRCNEKIIQKLQTFTRDKPSFDNRTTQ